jgi:hypothetical protein
VDQSSLRRGVTPDFQALRAAQVVSCGSSHGFEKPSSFAFLSGNSSIGCSVDARKRALYRSRMRRSSNGMGLSVN